MSPYERSLLLDWLDEQGICPSCREPIRDCWCPEPEDTDDTEPDTMET